MWQSGIYAQVALGVAWGMDEYTGMSFSAPPDGLALASAPLRVYGLWSARKCLRIADDPRVSTVYGAPASLASLAASDHDGRLALQD